MSALDDNILFEDAKLMFRNFAGAEKQFNSAGDRNFLLLLDELQADKMKRLGLNVKYFKQREEDDEPQAYMKVKVNYGKGRPPRIVMVTSAGRQEMGADEIFALDYLDLKKVDLTINPYNYNIPGGNSGVTAYLKTGFFFIDEDPLELKYANMEEANPTSQLSSTASDEAMAL